MQNFFRLIRFLSLGTNVRELQPGRFIRCRRGPIIDMLIEFDCYYWPFCLKKIEFDLISTTGQSSAMISNHFFVCLYVTAIFRERRVRFYSSGSQVRGNHLMSLHFYFESTPDLIQKIFVCRRAFNIF